MWWWGGARRGQHGCHWLRRGYSISRGSGHRRLTTTSSWLDLWPWRPFDRGRHPLENGLDLSIQKVRVLLLSQPGSRPPELLDRLLVEEARLVNSSILFLLTLTVDKQASNLDILKKKLGGKTQDSRKNSFT